MSYLTVRNINGNNYFYLQESFRDNGRVRTRTLRYVGKASGMLNKNDVDEISRNRYGKRFSDLTLQEQDKIEKLLGITNISDEDKQEHEPTTGVHIVSSEGMKKGYYKIIKKVAPGFEITVRSGLNSKTGAQEIAKKLNSEQKTYCKANRIDRFSKKYDEQLIIDEEEPNSDNLAKAVFDNYKLLHGSNNKFDEQEFSDEVHELLDKYKIRYTDFESSYNDYADMQSH